MIFPVVSCLVANCSTLWLQQLRRSCLRNCWTSIINDLGGPEALCRGTGYLALGDTPPGVGMDTMPRDMTATTGASHQHLNSNNRLPKLYCKNF